MNKYNVNDLSYEKIYHYKLRGLITAEESKILINRVHKLMYMSKETTDYEGLCTLIDLGAFD